MKLIATVLFSALQFVALAELTAQTNIEICSCTGRGGVEGVTMWGPEGEYCAGIPDDSWGTYNASCK